MNLLEAVPGEVLRGGPFRWTMGLRSLAAEGWLQIDGAYSADLAEKQRLLAERGPQIVGSEPGSEAPALELLELIESDLRDRNIKSTPRTDLHPIDQAGRLVQEDLCLMQRRHAEWILTAASVCFPTSWDLMAKMGRSLAAIHEPVPRYDSSIAPLVDRFFDRMKPGSLTWRSNWSLVGESSLRLEPIRRQAPSTCPADPGDQLFLRVERQTLRRLVRHSDAVCFTIRIHRWPLEDVLDQLPAGAISDALTALPTDVAEYKNLNGLRSDVCSWLAAHDTD